MSETEWSICRAAIRKRLQGIIGPNDLDDATQDAVVRCASLIGKTGKHWAWCAVVAARREKQHCRNGYRPLFTPADRLRWEDEIDTGRMVIRGDGAPLSREEMAERGLISAQELRLAAGTDR